MSQKVNMKKTSSIIGFSFSHSLVQEIPQSYDENPESGHAGIFKTCKRFY